MKNRLQTLHPSVWLSTQNFNSIKTTRPSEQTRFPDISGTWFYTVTVLKPIDGQEITVENTVETEPRHVQVTQNGRYVTLEFPRDRTRDVAGTLAGILHQSSGQPLKLHVSDYDDNGYFEYTLTPFGWYGAYKEAGSSGSKEQSPTAGTAFLARSMENLQALKNMNDEASELNGEYLYFAKLLKKDGTKEMSVHNLQELGPATVTTSSKGGFVAVNALGGTLPGVFHKSGTESTLHVADHLDNGMYVFKNYMSGLAASYLERGEFGSADQTATTGRVYLAKSENQLQEMIANDGTDVIALPQFLTYKKESMRSQNGTAPNVNNISTEIQTWEVDQNGVYATFKNEQEGTLPGILTKDENGTWVLQIARTADNGFYKLDHTGNGEFAGVYVESGNVGSMTQSTEVGFVKGRALMRLETRRQMTE